MARAHYLLCFCLLAMSAGCTHVQLQKDVVNQATTVGDLQIQQVLNNLAMFVYNYDSMPYFCYPNQGATIVTDQGQQGAIARVTGPQRGGVIAAFVFNGQGVEAQVTGPSETGSEPTAAVFRMIRSISYPAQAGQ